MRDVLLVFSIYLLGPCFLAAAILACIFLAQDHGSAVTSILFVALCASVWKVLSKGETDSSVKKRLLDTPMWKLGLGLTAMLFAAGVGWSCFIK